MSESEEPKFTESCGCVFCDLGLEPDNTIDGRPVHSHRMDGVECYMFCTHPSLDAALSSPALHED